MLGSLLLWTIVVFMAFYLATIVISALGSTKGTLLLLGVILLILGKSQISILVISTLVIGWSMTLALKEAVNGRR